MCRAAEMPMVSVQSQIYHFNSNILFNEIVPEMFWEVLKYYA